MKNAILLGAIVLFPFEIVSCQSNHETTSCGRMVEILQEVELAKVKGFAVGLDTGTWTAISDVPYLKKRLQDEAIRFSVKVDMKSDVLCVRYDPTGVIECQDIRLKDFHILGLCTDQYTGSLL